MTIEIIPAQKRKQEEKKKDIKFREEKLPINTADERFAEGLNELIKMREASKKGKKL